MTIEINTEDLSEVLEQAQHYGACILKMKTTDGDDVWIAVQNSRAGKKRQKALSAEQTAASSNPAAVTQ